MTEKTGADAEREEGRMHIHLPRYVTRDVRRMAKKLDVGPSSVIRSLYDQAKAAKLPLFMETEP